MSLEKKMKKLLEAYPGYGKNRESEAPAQGSSQKPHIQNLEKGSGGGKTVNKSNAGVAPLGPKVGAYEDKPAKQGDSKDSPIEDLGKDEPGNEAYKKGKPKAGLTARGPGSAPNFKTVADPTSVINKPSSSGNVHQEETEEEGELVETEETEELEELEETHKECEDEDEEENEKTAKAKKEFATLKREELERDVKNLFSEEVDLTEEFKTKALSLFEAAVMGRVAHEVSLIEEAVASKAVKIIAEREAALVEKLDDYMTYVAQQFLEQNEVGVENMLRTEIAENFMASLHTAFAENFIDVPDEKYDVLGEMQESIASLQEENERVVDIANELAEELLSMKRGAVVAQVTEGLAKTQIEKFTSLVEEITFEDEASFADKLQIVKKNLFSGNDTSTTQNVVEELDGSDPIINEAVDPEIAAINAKISGKMRF